MRTIVRFRFLILGVIGAGLIVGTVLAMRSHNASHAAGHLGPTPGPSTAGHVATKRSYLDRIAGSHGSTKAAALVSLTGYVSASQAAALTGGMDATAVFVQFPESQPELLTVNGSLVQTVSTRASEVGTAMQAEIADISNRLAAAKGTQRSTLAAALAQRKAQAEALPTCKCVFAFAVRDVTVSDLNALQRRGGVKLVDVPDPLTDDLSGFELVPISPKNKA